MEEGSKPPFPARTVICAHRLQPRKTARVTQIHTPDWTVSPTRHFFSRHWCEGRSVQGPEAELKEGMTRVLGIYCGKGGLPTRLREPSMTLLRGVVLHTSGVNGFCLLFWLRINQDNLLLC